MASTLTNLLYHVVFSTKQRIPLITEALEADLYAYMGGIIRGQGGILLEIGGIANHVHLLAKFKPSVSVSKMLQFITGDSSQWANEKKMKMRKFGWQEGYAAFSVSTSQVDAVRSYI